jgi:chromosomal replication initiator protein
VGQPSVSLVDAICVELQAQLGARNYNHWFHEKTTLTVCADELTIGVQSPFLLTWMQKQFRTMAQKAAQVVLGPSARLSFQVDASACGKPPASEPVRFAQAEATRTPSAGRLRAVPSKRSSPKSTARRFADLGDFVTGSCNELAWTAARQVCEAPGTRYSPVYIHGGVGTGKTHLLEGIYRAIRQEDPTLNVVFLTSEAFANFFTQALRDHSLPSFRQRFRNVDVLLIDDVDFLNAKRVIQEEFLHTFKELASRGRQIVLTADRHPRLLTKLSDELTSRFFSGLVCRLEAPDVDTRLRIVEKKASRMGAEFASDALNFVARRFKSNVRELEGALNCLQTYYTMTGKPVTQTLARQVLADLERDCIRIVQIADIERAVCHLFGLQPTDLKSTRRSRSVSQPRMLAMYLSRQLTQAAYSEIGQYFGDRNHSTVVSAEKRVRSWLNEDGTVRVSTQTWSVDDVLQTLEQQIQVG